MTEVATGLNWRGRVLAATAVVRREQDGRPADGPPLGTAVLIEPGRLLTCRHVVTVDGTPAGDLHERVWVVFADHDPMPASPVMEASPAAVDALVLELAEQAGDDRAAEPAEATEGDDAAPPSDAVPPADLAWVGQGLPQPVMLSGKARHPREVELIGYPSGDRTG